MDDNDARALVEAALQHDDEAARKLVRRLYPFVAKIVRAHRPRRTSEEDLCQMIFIKVFQKLSQFSGRVPLEHWVAVEVRLLGDELVQAVPEYESCREVAQRAGVSYQTVSRVINNHPMVAASTRALVRGIADDRHPVPAAR